jgi:hypothetical protein
MDRDVRDPTRAEKARDLGDRPRHVGQVLEDRVRDHGIEARVRELELGHREPAEIQRSPRERLRHELGEAAVIGRIEEELANEGLPCPLETVGPPRREKGAEPRTVGDELGVDADDLVPRRREEERRRGALPAAHVEQAKARGRAPERAREPLARRAVDIAKVVLGERGRARLMVGEELTGSADLPRGPW